MLARLETLSLPFGTFYKTLPYRYSRQLSKKSILHVGDGRSPNASLYKGLGVITSDLLLSGLLGFLGTTGLLHNSSAY